MRLEEALHLKDALVLDLGARSQAAEVLAVNVGRPAASRISLGVVETDAEYLIDLRFYDESRATMDLIAEVRERANGALSTSKVSIPRAQTVAPPLSSVVDPALIGCSISHPRVTAGTLGCVVRQVSSGQHCILSNNHVLAHVNRAALGDRITQPGTIDATAGNRRRIGRLLDFVRIDRDGVNRVDAAISTMEGRVDANLIPGFGDKPALPVVEPQSGLRVFKVGRTTGVTSGTIRAIGIDELPVNLGRGFSRTRFSGQFEVVSETGSFSAGGDSGSVIWTEEGAPVGLLFAGDGVRTYANPMSAVMAELGIEVI